jgi:hypothetical protein
MSTADDQRKQPNRLNVKSGNALGPQVHERITPAKTRTASDGFLPRTSRIFDCWWRWCPWDGVVRDKVSCYLFSSCMLLVWLGDWGWWIVVGIHSDISVFDFGVSNCNQQQEIHSCIKSWKYPSAAHWECMTTQNNTWFLWKQHFIAMKIKTSINHFSIDDDSFSQEAVPVTTHCFKKFQTWWHSHSFESTRASLSDHEFSRLNTALYM